MYASSASQIKVPEGRCESSPGQAPAHSRLRRLGRTARSVWSARPERFRGCRFWKPTAPERAA